MELTTILMRTLFTYFFILILLRIMGKRELGKLSVFDVVISIMLAEMAVLAIDEVDKPAMYFYLPMVLITLMEVGMAYLSMKSKKIRDIVDGSAEVIIENGHIREETMRRNRINMDDLMVGLRQKEIKNLADVEFAVLEPTGEMSVFRKNEAECSEDDSTSVKNHVSRVNYTGLPIPLILDGEVRKVALQKIGQNEFWLKKELRKHGIKHIKDVSFCSIDEHGMLFIDKKDQSKPRPH